MKTAKEKEVDYWKENDRMIEILAGLKVREAHTLERKIKAGEIDYDPTIDKLYYTNSKEEYTLEDGDDSASEDSES